MLADWSEAWFRWIAAASWQLALLTAIVAATTWALRRGSARLRHALWLLVLVKALLPPSVTAPWGIGAWAVAPAMQELESRGVALRSAAESSTALHPQATANVASRGRELSTSEAFTVVDKLPAIWAAGATLLFGSMLWRYWRLRREVARMEPVDEGPLRIELERLALQLRVRRTPELYLSAARNSPFLIGTLRPAIVLPAAMEPWPADDVRAVLLHELTHWRRGDPWIGWLQAAVQALYWFHPCVWWANHQIRQEREVVCDEAAIRAGSLAPESYSATLLKVVGAARGCSLSERSLAGVFERGTDLPQRLEAIMNCRTDSMGVSWGTWGATLAAAMVLLPMAPLTTVAQEKPEATATAKAPQKRTAEKKQPAPFPEYQASPANGTAGVDPSVKEIVLRFDRDMNDSMSVTGDPKLLPPLDPGAKPRWRNARTFVLPVKLAEGAYYRVGINSKSHQKFRSSDGTPAPPTVIAFTTKGASKELDARLAAPKVVSTEPAIGAKDVDAGITELKVTFDVPMGDGMSFVGDVPGVPGGRPNWSEDGKSITLPIKLEPGQAYQFGLNSPRHANFQSVWRVPLEPVVFEFSTKK